MNVVKLWEKVYIWLLCDINYYIIIKVKYRIFIRNDKKKNIILLILLRFLIDGWIKEIYFFFF